MIPAEKQYKYVYNPRFDSLNIYLGHAQSFYSDEEDYGIYKIYNEETDDLIGIEILYYSRRSDEVLNKVVPFNFNKDAIETIEY